MFAPPQNSKSTMIINVSSPVSSEIQKSVQSPPSISIETVENSILSLITNWDKRQKWKRFLHSTQQEQEKRSPWRMKLSSFLESNLVRVITISLLLVDLVFTILELSSSLLSCKSTRNKPRAGSEILYHWIGIAILSLLSLKSAALVVALGGSFFRRPGYVVDGVVLVVALVLEAYLEKMGGGLVVMVSLWRVVRVVESAFELSDEAIEAQIEGVVCEFQTLKDENRRLLGIIDEKNEVIEKLQKELDHYCQKHAGQVIRIKE